MQAMNTYLEPEFLKKLERLHLVAKKLSWRGMEGEHPSPRKGFSLEFSDYRRYQRGDDLRYVDWNIYRRLQKLFLKVFTAEEEMNIYLLLDASRSMGEGSPPKIQYAKSVAAALGYIGLKSHDRVGGAGFSSDLGARLSMGRGKRQILTLFEFLGNLPNGGETNLGASVEGFSRSFPQPGLVVLLSDLLDPQGCQKALQDLLARKHEIFVIHILDETEVKLSPYGDVSLVDVESEREKRLFLDADLMARFDDAIRAYLEEIESFCSTRGIDYLRTFTSVPFEEFVLRYLRQGRTLKS